MKQNKKIYILMATYNGEKFLKDQIDSILKQTYKNWILWIHDDNSTDNTVNIIKEYQNKYSDKIKFIDDNISTGGAKENFAYLLGKIDDNFDYLMFSDQDDVWLENKIELTLDKMIESERKNISKPILIHTDLKVVDEKLNIISNSYFEYQKINPDWSKNLEMSLVQNSVTGCTIMINKKAKEVSLPISRHAIMHDWWILLKVLQSRGVVEYINKPTVLYRQHGFNQIGANKISLIRLLTKVNSIIRYKQMANDLNISRSIFKIVYLKIKILLERLI